MQRMVRIDCKLSRRTGRGSEARASHGSGVGGTTQGAGAAGVAPVFQHENRESVCILVIRGGSGQSKQLAGREYLPIRHE